MDIKVVVQTIESNQDEIERLESEIKVIAPEVPQLENYTEEDFIKYLIEQEIYPTDSDYTTYKNHLMDSYEKRQELLTNRDYYVTLNIIMRAMLDFYTDNLRDPTEDELKVLAEGSGTQDHIDQAIAYILDTFL